ncbi:MAG: hypothetical protein HFH86_02885 [Bacilli bacterium]|nr:hypothetical protein [Bacilli bacterium]
MFVFLSALGASLDGFIIGLSLKLSHQNFSKKNMVTFLIGNFILYFLALFLYSAFHFHFVNRFLSTVLYLLLAYLTWRDQGEDIKERFSQSLSFSKCLLLVFTHCIDGTLVSLSFVYEYSIPFLVILFSMMSFFILLIGYYFAHLFKNPKKSNLFGALLFVLLAILNQFF